MAVKKTSGTGVTQIGFIEALDDFIVAQLSAAFATQDIAAEIAITSHATISAIANMLSDAQMTIALGAGPDSYFTLMTGDGAGKTTAYTGWTDALERMRLIPHLSYTAGVKSTSQPGGPNGDDVAVSLPSQADSALTFDYWIFGDDADPFYIHAVFRIATDYAQHCSLGKLIQPTGVNGGFYIVGTSDDVTLMPESDWDAVTAGGGFEIGSAIGLRTGVNGSENGWVQGHDHSPSLLAANLNNWYRYRDNSTITSLPNKTTFLQAIPNLAHVGEAITNNPPVYCVHHSRTRMAPGNAVAPIVPCNFFMPKDELASNGARVYAYFGQLPNMFYIDLTNIEPFTDIQVGPDSYFCFPALGAKDVFHASFPQSRNYGIAIKNPA